MLAKARPIVDSADRLRKLVDSLSPRLRRRFLEIIDQVRRSRSLGDLAELVQQGRALEVLDAIERAALLFAAEVASVYVAAANDTAAFLRDRAGVVVAFDQTNDRAVRIMANSRLELVSGLRAEQRDVIREVLAEGLEEGTNPRETARLLRDSFGLTPRQVRAVRNYRVLLNARSSEALDRQLRDRRFDRTVAAAVRDDAPLAREQIDRMVSRYRDRYLAYRATVVSRTESLRAVHQGVEEMFAQAIDGGDLSTSGVTRQWNTARDGRVRDSHRTMHRQTRPFGETFVSGAGNALRYPCDPSAPASESVQCRCVLSTRISFE